MSAEKRQTITSAINNVVGAAKDLEFVPREEHKKLKADFWALERENPSTDPEFLTAALVAEITNSSQVHKYWSIPGFRDWFINKQEARQKAEFLFNELLASMSMIVYSDDPKSFSAKLALFKSLGDYLGHTSRAAPVKDRALPTDPEELEALVGAMQKRLGVGNA